MPDLTISDLKRALVEVKRICAERGGCGGCPFGNEKSNFCPITDRPDLWNTEEWKEDSDDVCSREM